MSEAFRTLIVTAQDAPLCREIAVTLGGQAGANLWMVGLSADGQEPATNYVSTGCIAPEFADMMPTATYEYIDDEWVQTAYDPGNAAMVVAACAAADPPLTVTEQEIEDIYSRSDVTQQEPFVAFGRLGLQLIYEDVDV